MGPWRASGTLSPQESKEKATHSLTLPLPLSCVAATGVLPWDTRGQAERDWESGGMESRLSDIGAQLPQPPCQHAATVALPRKHENISFQLFQALAHEMMSNVPKNEARVFM